MPHLANHRRRCDRGRSPISLYSFLPNVVWLPRPLAALTDADGAFAQTLLKVTSIRLFKPTIPAADVLFYTTRSWAQLPHPAGEGLSDEWTSPAGLATFTSSALYARRRLAYNRKLTAGVAAAAAGQQLPRRIICSRYASGLPLLSPGRARSAHRDIVQLRRGR